MWYKKTVILEKHVIMSVYISI